MISVRAGVFGPRRVGLVVAIGLALASGAASEAAADTSVGPLGEGQSVFWDGSYVANAGVRSQPVRDPGPLLQLLP